MRTKWRTTLQVLSAILLSVTVLAGCGGTPVADRYPLESVSQNGSQLSRVYRAENKTVPEVAHELAEQNQPQEMSKEDPDRMFLVYPDELYHLQKDPKKPSDTLIEVDNREFVRQNYDSSFLEGYLVGTLLDNLFGSFRGYHGHYRGYSSREIYRPDVVYHAPTPSEQKRYPPPITKQGVGSIIKRSSSGGEAGTAVGSDGSLTKKEKSTSGSWGGFGRIIRSSDSSDSGGDQIGSGWSSIFSRPKSNSPPKTRVGGFGRLTRRR